MLLGIENTRRGSAEGPYFALHVDAPYKVDEQFKLDGNGGNILPRQHSPNVDGFLHYGATTAHLIHPGTSLDVVAVRGALKDPASVSDLIEFMPFRAMVRLAAVGFALTEFEVVRGAEDVVPCLLRARYGEAFAKEWLTTRQRAMPGTNP
jgi:hypothetical protein